MRWFTHRPAWVFQESVKPLHVQSRSHVFVPHDHADVVPLLPPLLPLLVLDPPEDEVDEEEEEDEEDEDEDDVDDVPPASLVAVPLEDAPLPSSSLSKPVPSGSVIEGESVVGARPPDCESSTLPAAHAASAMVAPMSTLLRTDRHTPATPESSLRFYRRSASRKMRAIWSPNIGASCGATGRRVHTRSRA